MEVLKVKNISKSYNKNKVLDNISFNVNKGEIVSIIGPSGVGKSTLLRCINNLEKIDNGEIIINNQNINKSKTNLDVGLIFQDYNLFPQYSVIKNITLSLTKVVKLQKEEATKIARNLLIKLNLSNKEKSYPCELSGGEKQRVAICRAIATNPTILCFDEPTSALDSKLVKQVFQIIKELSFEGKAILIVTHDIKFAEEVSDKIIHLKS
jgi:polar amino acid transport system ATP-binding protein